MSSDKPRCFYCESPAIRFCDGILAWLAAPAELINGKYYRAVVAAPGENGVIDPRFICSRPLCEIHIESSSPVFFCRGKGAHTDSKDYCETCVNEDRQHDAKNRAAESVLVTQDEGEALQRRRLMRFT